MRHPLGALFYGRMQVLQIPMTDGASVKGELR